MTHYKKIVAAVSVLLSVSSTSAFADGGVGSAPNPYSDCGIGAAIFPDTDWAAATSNIIWDLGTTAITSATASPETCSSRNVSVAKFIGQTYDNIVEDTAKGDGEYVTAMLDIYECNAEAKDNIIAELRVSLSEELTADDFVTKSKLEKAESLYGQVNEVVYNRDIVISGV